MRAPAQLDNSNRGHVSPPEPLLFGLCDTKYHQFHAARNHPLLATIAAQQAFQRSPRPPRGVLILDSPVHLPWNGCRRHTGGVET